LNKTLEYYLSLDYPVEIRRIDDSLGGGYVASIPGLGSQAFAGDGETPQEAYENLQAAKKEIFEEYLAEGAVIPEPVGLVEYEDYSGKLVLRMPRELHARLANAAKRNETSLNQFIVYALSGFEAKWNVIQEVKDLVSTSSNCQVTSYQQSVIPTQTISAQQPKEPIVKIYGLERDSQWN
jgi:predicted HicB family RNase H-like nuclease